MRNPHLPLTLKPVEPIPEKKVQRVPKPAPAKEKINRPPAVYSSQDREELIDKYLKMMV